MIVKGYVILDGESPGGPYMESACTENWEGGTECTFYPHEQQARAEAEARGLRYAEAELHTGDPVDRRKR